MSFRPSAVLLAIVLFQLGASAQAAMPTTAMLRGKVTDFDDRYVFIGAVTEQYRIKRSVVPEEIDLKPGAVVSMEVPFASIKIIPATAPVLSPGSGPGMAPPALRPYHPPRKRQPAQD